MNEDRMLQDHKSTYSGFLRFATVGSAIVAIVLILMGLFLA
ncbi:MAG: aa3-type cytochrome c oxidase subunit IV [Pseudomonadota bacterium]